MRERGEGGEQGEYKRKRREQGRGQKRQERGRVAGRKGRREGGVSPGDNQLHFTVSAGHAADGTL